MCTLCVFMTCKEVQFLCSDIFFYNYEMVLSFHAKQFALHDESPAIIRAGFDYRQQL